MNEKELFRAATHSEKSITTGYDDTILHNWRTKQQKHLSVCLWPTAYVLILCQSVREQALTSWPKLITASVKPWHDNDDGHVDVDVGIGVTLTVGAEHHHLRLHGKAGARSHSATA